MLIREHPETYLPVRLLRWCAPLALLALASPAPAQVTSLVRPGPDGRLHYAANERGDVIPDFSGAGGDGVSPLIADTDH